MAVEKTITKKAHAPDGQMSLDDLREFLAEAGKVTQDGSFAPRIRKKWFRGGIRSITITVMASSGESG